MTEPQPIPHFEPSLEEAKKIVGHVQLENVHMMSFAAKREPMLDNVEGDELQVQTTRQVGGTYYAEARTIIALVEIGAFGKHDDQPCFQIAAAFRAVYRISEDCPTPNLEAAAHSFVQLNALAHVWPYWREYCSQGTIRLGMSPLIAPLLVIPQGMVRPKSQGLQEPPS